ncbi:MAG: hypothetical protein QNJ13_05325 [Paracoccaceae bacterium]|nr:hypothetical protein [Paracoccaceae bacterium]
MLATLILAAAAGWLAPKAEETVKGMIESVLLAEAPLTAVELRLISFAACLVAAAILSMIFGEPHALTLAVGALLGVLGPRLTAKYRQSRNPDYDS